MGSRTLRAGRQARTNTNVATFEGTGLMTGGSTDDTTLGVGTMYFPNALLRVGGTGDTFVNSLIANKIEVYGAGRKTVTQGYDTEAGTTNVYLAE